MSDNPEPILIKLDSKHEGFVVTKKVYVIFTISKFIINIAIILGITYMFYSECLFNPDANSIVLTYFALISFVCILNLGIPIDKLANISLSA